jgi:carboxymethylenebutenolidase
MSEFTAITTPDGTFSAYVARPATKPARVLIVLQEIFGVNPDMRQTADELAAQGFIAMCPDLFWRAAPGIQLSDKTDWDKAGKLYEEYDLDKGVDDIAATIKAAHALPGASGKVGLMGFCLGGLMTFLTAARTDVDAAVSYYGGRTERHLSEAPNVKAPFMMHVGEDDEYISRDAQQAIKAAFAGQPDKAIFTYPGQGHAFGRHRGTRYDAEAAALANARTVEFFRKHLG